MTDVVVYVIGGLMFAAGFTFLFSPLAGAPPLPSTPRAKDTMIEMVRRLDPHGTQVVEVGAGWGGFAVRLSKAFPERSVTSWEISPMPFAVAWLRSLGRRNLTIRFGDGLKAIARDGGTDSVVMYLCTGLQKRAEAILPHVRGVVVSNTFPMPNAPIAKAVKAGDWARSTIYAYHGTQGDGGAQASHVTGDEQTASAS